MTDTALLAHAVADRLLDQAERIVAQPDARLITSLSPATEHAVLAWLDLDELHPAVKLLPWQRAQLEQHGIDPDEVERWLEEGDGRKAHGDPSIAGDGIVLPVDADCPACGWPERTFDTRDRKFGCIRCTYTSDERNA